MESSILAMFVFLLLGAVVSPSVLPPELYWKTLLPDVPMPQAVKGLLKPGNAGKVASNGAKLDPNVFSYDARKPSDPNAFSYDAGKHYEPNMFQYEYANVFGNKAGNAGKVASNGAKLDPNAFSYDAGKHSEPNMFQYEDANVFGNKAGNAGKVASNGAKLDPNVFTYDAGKPSDPNVFSYIAGKHSEPNIFQYEDANVFGNKAGNAGKVASNGAELDPNGFLYHARKPSDPNAFTYTAGKHSEPNIFQYEDANIFGYKAGNAGKDASNGAELDPNGFLYNAGKPSDPNVFNTESKDKVNDYGNLFFLENELHPGSKINVHLARSTEGAIFLPRQQADAIPFSSEMLSEAMDKLSVKPHSMEGKIMEQTIRTCEEPANEGEEKYCATSLESMVDFVVSKLGRNVHSISTEVGKEETSRQVYTTGLGIERIGGANSIICHTQAYAYPVYYCHATQSTKVYVIPFSTAEGSTTRAIAVCHTDTSKWNPEHMAFQVLKIKPGTIPVCHFLPEGHIVWTSDETFA